MRLLFFILPLLVFFSACSSIQEKIEVPKKKKEKKEKKENHVKKLKKEVKKLNSHDKRLIYKSIKNEINLHKKKGDEDYKSGYFYDAIKSYKLVNFYEGYYAIPKSTLAYLQSKSKIRAKTHYIKAQKYISTNNKKALMELNTVLMNDPEYKNTKKLYDEIRDYRDIKIYIDMLENQLTEKSINYNGQYKELKSIQNSINTLAKYDYKNSALQKAKNILKEVKGILMKDAIKLYEAKKYEASKKQFLFILTLYENDKKALSYMERINFKESKKHNLYLAKKFLDEDKYLLCIKYAKKVLQLEHTNPEAIEIVKKAKINAQKAVERFVKEGKRYYNTKNLDKAKVSFEKALAIDKTDNTSLIYHKRIERQLQTIKSLQ